MFSLVQYSLLLRGPTTSFKLFFNFLMVLSIYLDSLRGPTTSFFRFVRPCRFFTKFAQGTDTCFSLFKSTSLQICKPITVTSFFLFCNFSFFNLIFSRIRQSTLLQLVILALSSFSSFSSNQDLLAKTAAFSRFPLPSNNNLLTKTAVFS